MATTLALSEFSFSPPTGQAALPVVELDRAMVEGPRRRVVKAPNQWPSNPHAVVTTTLGHALSTLQLREWEFYHAVAKTALACNCSSDERNDFAHGAYLQNRHLLEWHRDNLRLRPTGVFSRADAARTSTSGRFGEAVLHLFMMNRGYIYWDHIPSLIERAMNANGMPHEEQVKIAHAIASKSPHGGDLGKRPDFAFESRAGDVALGEAKGGFIEPNGKPTMVKGDMAQGLLQLAAWMDRIAPAPEKSFVVGTYLRERGDPFHDPSLLAFVDPTNDDPDLLGRVEFPKDWIKRGNYGAWLIGMGFVEAGLALRTLQEIATRPRNIPIVSIGNREFAVTFDTCCFPEWWLFDEFPFFPLRRSLRHRDWEPHIPVFGIEVGTLRSIEKSVNNSSQPLIVEAASQELPATAFPEWLSGSILPDGTLFGLLHVARSSFPPLGVDTFKL